jgi:L-gulonolactone oxidase
VVEQVEPRSLGELQAAVTNAARAGGSVRAAGGRYSWSPLVPNPGTIVSTSALAGLLGFDEKAHTVTVECGMTIETLSGLVAARRHTLITPTLFPRPSVGGVIATGSHGSDFAHGNFSDQILEMQIVRADGSVTSVRRGDVAYPAAQVALGALGIVYSVKLQLEPEFPVYVDRRYLPVHYVLQELADLRASCDFLEIFWFPLQSKMWVYLMSRTDSKPDPETPWSRLRKRMDTWLEKEVAGSWIPQAARFTPRFTPVLNRVASRFANKVEVSVQSASDAFHHQKAYPKNWDLCYAVPAAAAACAWSEAISLVDQYARADLYPINLALHCRFTAGSSAWLAPNHGRPTCYIEVATAKGTPRWAPFFRELESRWLAIEGARPHWGKLYWRFGELAGRYPRMNDFLDVRRQWDPDRVFLNPFLEQEVFQLPPRAPAQPQPSRGGLQPVAASPGPT